MTKQSFYGILNLYSYRIRPVRKQLIPVKKAKRKRNVAEKRIMIEGAESRAVFCPDYKIYVNTQKEILYENRCT